MGQAQQDGQAWAVVQSPGAQPGVARDLLDSAKGKLHLGPHDSIVPLRQVFRALPVHLATA